MSFDTKSSANSSSIQRVFQEVSHSLKTEMLVWLYSLLCPQNTEQHLSFDFYQNRNSLFMKTSTFCFYIPWLLWKTIYAYCKWKLTQDISKIHKVKCNPIPELLPFWQSYFKTDTEPQVHLVIRYRTLHQ